MAVQKIGGAAPSPHRALNEVVKELFKRVAVLEGQPEPTDAEAEAWVMAQGKGPRGK